MELTHDEVMNILDIQYFPSQRTGCIIVPGTYEISDINKTLAYLLPLIVKARVTSDNIRLRSSFIITQTLIFTEKSSFRQCCDLSNQDQPRYATSVDIFR